MTEGFPVARVYAPDHRRVPGEALPADGDHAHRRHGHHRHARRHGMTPLDTVPLRLVGRTSVLTLIGRGVGALARRGARAGILTAAAVRLALRFVLMVAGFGCLDAAAWLWAVPAGLVAIGLSCLVLEWAVKGGGGRR